MTKPMESDLSLEFLRVVEQAAIASAHTMGQGDRHRADQAAVEAMRREMDTVPIDGMTVPPFEPVIANGRITGRGSVDVKGGMAAMLFAFQRLVRERPATSANVVLSCTCDEEATTIGIHSLVNRWQAGDLKLLLHRPDFAIIAEPTSLDPHFQDHDPTINVQRHIYEYLVGQGPRMELIPELAETWHARDPLTWEFRLRRGVVWHDGAPFTGNTVFGMSVGYLFAEALAAAGEDPTRESLVAAIESGDLLGNGIVPLSYGEDDHAAYRGVGITTVDDGVQDYVEICPPIAYKAALKEMLQADGLLVMQASNCNAQIPAKIYEYLRARRPVLCLSDEAGDTVGVLRAAGLDRFARLDDAADIAHALQASIAEISSGRSALPDPDYVRQASRTERSKLFAEWLDGVVAGTGR